MPLNIETFLVTFWTVFFYGFVFVYSLFVHCKVNPFGAVGKYIYHLFFVTFLGLEGKRNPKYF